MADRTSIEWSDATWNPIRGCTRVSPGCGGPGPHGGCYAEGIAARFSGPGQAYEGLAEMRGGKPRWTGKLAFVEGVLTLPLRWRRPRRIFVNSMSDLFHEAVPDEWIDRVFAVMALAPQHTMQVLTKRSARMRAYMNDPYTPYRVAREMDGVLVDLDHDPVERWAAIPGYAGYEASTHGAVRSSSGPLATGDNPLHEREQVTLWNGGAPRTWFVHALVLMAHRGLPPEGHEARHRNGDKKDNRLANLLWGTRSDNQTDKVRHGSIGGPQKLTLEQVAAIRAARADGCATQQGVADRYGISRSLVSMIESGRVWPCPISWPLKSVWLGVSTEDQRRADERVPDLLATPAAVRFVSAEPLLGPIDFTNLDPDGSARVNGAHGWSAIWRDNHIGRAWLDWIIVGGESGPAARPMHPAWARSVRDQCAAAGTAFLFKQWGAWLPGENAEHPFLKEPGYPERPRLVAYWQDGGWGPRNTPRPQANYVMWEPDGTSHHGERSAGGYFKVAAWASRVGKKAAGRLLDGREWNDMPEVRP